MLIFLTSSTSAGPIKQGISCQPDPQGHLPFQNVRDTRASGHFLAVRKYWILLFLHDIWEMGRMRWLVVQCQGHEARAERQTANTTFGIQAVHLTSGPWKQVLEPYGKQLELPFQTTGFCQCQKEERRDEVTCLGNFPLWFSPSKLCQKYLL